MDQRISLVTLAVDDLDAVRRFFEDGLGWIASRQSQDGVVFFQTGGSVLALYPRRSLETDIGRAIPSGPGGAVSLAWNGRSEAEVDAAYAQALAAGAEPVTAPEKVFWGGYCAYVAIPGGHLLEISFNPFWPLGADGALTLPD
ncbi:VOC family protein [Polymorphum gilvum]|uniref:Glyoxalase family protein n=1 Tax=Polymorphum gilvum (strain LMG 25793 / CGMCC 1.9160 / SL003B-26A1) TaxID=991905 RepID=F2IV71_POLGS|nr:VOC family protein [Polymorphum gilvum]ADZ71402.1 Glyoxalase family protein [Polymorphum gilvum SL003B-26A1]